MSIRKRFVLWMCRRAGHEFWGCYSVSGSVGDRCERCGEIRWSRVVEPWGLEHWKTQAPTFPTLWAGNRRTPWFPVKRWLRPPR